MALDEIGFEDHTEMVNLVAKLRINAEIKHVSSIDDEIEEINQSTGQILIDNNLEKDIDIDIDDDIKEDEEEQDEEDDFEQQRKRKVSQFARDKIVKYRRVGKTIEKYSKDAKLCLLTMPYPRKKFEWWEYSQIIHDLTPNDIPTIFVRGTSDQVLTFVF
eukprot:CAMPEP_0201571826 /NCGR_PEP_ID=MMETSP0190_2-20130828/14785_1 /ASSEMBLY_ACC=CAM_ASM_000263 /TAXON_ID=37353 /ORGANISM="Rosalina sp." /LENGTH=159 /DNA_ID=CAMNT_0047996913 /DNA_START=943 /DNA_END=1422 /DNA_ORIENTATION=+